MTSNDFDPTLPPLDPDFDYSWLSECGKEDAHAAVRPARRGAYLDKWVKAEAVTDELMEAGASRINNLIPSLNRGSGTVLSGLTPLMLYAMDQVGNSRPQTIARMTVTLQADLGDPAVVDENGDVRSDSLLYKVMDYLELVREAGVSRPTREFRLFIEDSTADMGWVAMRALLVPSITNVSPTRTGHPQCWWTTPAGPPYARQRSPRSVPRTGLAEKRRATSSLPMRPRPRARKHRTVRWPSSCP